jgi:hypothetical protein
MAVTRGRTTEAAQKYQVAECRNLEPETPCATSRSSSSHTTANASPRSAALLYQRIMCNFVSEIPRSFRQLRSVGPAIEAALKFCDKALPIKLD